MLNRLRTTGMKVFTYQLPNAAGQLVIRSGDITKCSADAIVNAASNQMLGGGGVDGAIHRAAGPRLVEQCKKLPEFQPNERCRTGEAVLLPGFQLLAPYVIATVGPRFSSRERSLPLLKSAFASCIKIASEKPDIHSVAFPAISCGVFRFPPELAAAASLEVFCASAVSSDFHLTQIIMVLSDMNMVNLWREAADNCGLLQLQNAQ